MKSPTIVAAAILAVPLVLTAAATTYMALQSSHAAAEDLLADQISACIAHQYPTTLPTAIAAGRQSIKTSIVQLEAKGLSLPSVRTFMITTLRTGAHYIDCQAFVTN